MSMTERFDLLLQRYQADELGADEVAELRDLLKTDPGLLDRYLDFCDLEEEIVSGATNHPAEVAFASPAETPGIAIDSLGRRPLTQDQQSTFRIAAVVVAIAAAIVLLVGISNVPKATRPQVGDVAMADPDATEVEEGEIVARPRERNPWKVINSTGSMNHPQLSEASIPKLASAGEKQIQFNRDIRPILSETCFHCHGPDDHGRRADLRLDTLDGAQEDRGGYQAIVPGDLENSEAWSRIVSEDPDLLMPPPESHLVLTPEQRTLLKRWIEQGAEYESHWAFIPPKMPDVPEVDFASGDTTWGHGPIDSFVAAKLAEAGLAPSSEADARTLLRRLTLDLTGLPPTVEEVRAFESDYASDGEVAYQNAITRLLDSPHFGERMAVPWMDQARYADTNGYSIDGGRDMWLWRDWVIQAYNDNMPFDQFVTEQLAGDLLPDATESQRIASGFNRNHMITHEGGTIPAENLVNYVADRVKTTSEVFLALTMGCAQCHDHKYDPISQKDYYQFFAFFNEVGDYGLDGNAGVNSAPRMMASSVLKSDELDSINEEIETVEQQLATATDGFDEWLQSERERETDRGNGFEFANSTLLDASSPNRPGPFTFDADGTVNVSEPSKGLNGFSHSIRLGNESGELVSGIRIEFTPRELIDDQSDSKDGDVSAERKKIAALTPFADGVPKITAVLISATTQPADQVDYNSQLVLSEATASSVADDHAAGSVLDERNLQWWQPDSSDTPQHLTLTFERPVDPKKTPFLSVLVFFGTRESLPFQWRMRPFAGRDSDSKWSTGIAEALMREDGERNDGDREQLLKTFRSSAPELADLRIQLANLEERREVLTGQHSTMVMNTAEKPRKTFVLERGQYDSPKEQVTPRTPGVLPPMVLVSKTKNHATDEDATEQGVDQSATRRDLARWLTDPQHPLTSRVAVNRIWATLFGTGIVATSADFGSQGEYPSHPELLDYLATRFVESGWNQKELIREMVSSSTYRQQSVASPEQLELDPRNRLLARGPRFRLPAEFIRDQALAVSKLLVPRIGGPSVQPYQPPGLWKEVSHFGSTPATKQVFVQDRGEKLYRRSLYTVVKRTSPHPAMAAFDAPNREMCIVDRGATNTPLQALVTLNDPQFAEASRAFAADLLSADAESDSQRIGLAFERVLSREPSEAEARAVTEFLNTERDRYGNATDAALQVVSVGEAPVAGGIDPAEHAAWTQVASLLLNLSEALTRP